MAVATVRTTYPLDTKSYAAQLFEKWGIGKKGQDNGLLILFVKKERRVEVEVGYGLEGIITDGFAGEVLDKYALPEFKKDDYGKGIYLAALAFSDRITEEYSEPAADKARADQPELVFSFTGCFCYNHGVPSRGSRRLRSSGTIVSGVIGAVIGYFHLPVLSGSFFGFFMGISVSSGGYYGGIGRLGWGGGFGGEGGGSEVSAEAGAGAGERDAVFERRSYRYGKME